MQAYKDTNTIIIPNDIENFNLYCRVCLQIPESAQILDTNIIYDEEEMLTYKDVFHICTQIDLLASKSLPCNLCKSCGLELQMAYDFYKKVENSQGMISQIIEQIENQEDKSSMVTDNVELEEVVDMSEINLATQDNESEEHIDIELEEDLSIKPASETIQIKLKSDETYEVIETHGASDEEEYLQLEFINNEDEAAQNEQKFVTNTHNTDLPLDVIKEAIEEPIIIASTIDENEEPIKTYKRTRLIGQYECPYCDKVFPNNSRMRIHCRTHEPHERVKFTCNICGRMYTSKQAMEAHVKTTHQKEGYVCDICGKIYAIKKGLEIHKRYHTGDFPYECDLCEKKFAQACHLNTHKKVHHNNLRFICETCGRVFTSSASLRSHEFSHSIMPFDCEFCGKGYPAKAKLKVHIQRKHDVVMTAEQLESMRKFHVMRSKLTTVRVKKN